MKKLFITFAIAIALALFPINADAWIIVTTVGEFNETIDNNTDDMIDFTGRRGSDNTDLRLDLDGTRPVFSSPTDNAIGFLGTVYIETLAISTAMTISEDFTISLNAADEEITINQTSVTGSANVGLIKINDDRTGATADVIAEATIWIDAEGVYAIGVVDGLIGSEGGYVPASSGGADLGSTTLEFDDLFLNDAGVIQLGDDQDVTITHVADAGILMELDDYISFGDNAVFIESDDDGYLDIQADTGVRIVGALSPKTDDGTALGSVNLNWSDLFIADSGVVNFGDDQDVKLTHVHDIGLQFELDDKFMFGDTAVYIHSNDDGYFDIVADTGTRLSGEFIPTTDDGGALGAANNNWSDLFLADAAILNFGDDQDVSFTHVADIGLQYQLDDKIMFGDTTVYIHSNDDGYFDIVADTGTRLSGEFIPTADDGGALGAANNNWSDLFLADAAVLNFGDDQDVKITHTADQGLTLTGGAMAYGSQAQTHTIEGDITALTSSVLLLTGDNDADNDIIDLQDGTLTGQMLYIFAAALIDGTDTITINMGDTTCTSCSAIVLDSIGDSAILTWTGTTWVTLAVTT